MTKQKKREINLSKKMISSQHTLSVKQTLQEGFNQFKIIQKKARSHIGNRISINISTASN